MSGAASPNLVVVGANHRSASLALRERLFVEAADFGGVFADLRAAGIAQALLLSTCDRVEVHAIHADAGAAARGIAQALAAHAGLDAAEVAQGLYMLSGAAAVRQLFAVASSLDSLVIGEPQVLGQVKESHRVAQAADMVGNELEGLLQVAYSVAKRVRSETTIGARPVSIAAAAVEVAREIHGDLGDRAGLLIGVGEMGELVATQLRAAGLGSLVVTHRSAARAETLARRLEANLRPFDALADALVAADVVVASVGLGAYVLTAETVREVIRRRRYRPIFVIDLAVPADAEPAINDLDGVFLYDTGDLEGITRAGIAGREAEAEDAWALIDGALAEYLRARAMRAATPAVVALREHFEATRARVLEETGTDAAEATRRLVNRLLHAPSAALREIAADGGEAERAVAERLLRRLFGLTAGDPARKEEKEK
ncbi:MAG: glutamyl-tRNA reductase [Alphaproteobacteria bacterium]